MDNNGPGGQKSWLHSEAYDTPPWKKNDLPRLSLFRFGSFSDAFFSIAKIVGQSVISWILFAMLFIVLVSASTENGQYFLAASEIVRLICVTISVFLAIRIFDDTDIKDMGLRLNGTSAMDVAAGFAIVFALLSFEFLLNLATGAWIIQGGAWEIMPPSGIFWNLVICLFIFLFVGWSEELLSRGFHLRILSKGLNRPLGILISSVIFSYLHHSNPGMTAGRYVGIFVAGVVFSIAFLRSGNLWLSMGLHAGWDFFVVAVGGAPISDLHIFHLMDIGAIPGVALSGVLLELLNLAIIAAVVLLYTRRRQGIKDW